MRPVNRVLGRVDLWFSLIVAGIIVVWLVRAWWRDTHGLPIGTPSGIESGSRR